MRIGIVGMGNMGILHAGIVNSMPDAQVVAICEKDSPLARLATDFLPKAEVLHSSLQRILAERGEFLWSLYAKNFSYGGTAGPYLDIGTGSSVNASVFKAKAGISEVVGVDIATSNKNDESVAILKADASHLPFRDSVFGFITMFSLIEHVSRQVECLREALRVMRKDGKFFMQMPNRYFPIELHSGLLFYFYLPKKLRNFLAEWFGRGWMAERDTPSIRKVKRLLKDVNHDIKVRSFGFSYPANFLPEGILRLFYSVCVSLGLMRVFPVGYVLLIC
jgi:SAM-dependent methyltransferase